MSDIEVVEWISYEDAEDKEDHIGSLGGWFGAGDRWSDYIANCQDESKPYAEAIKADVMKSRRLIGGDTHQRADDGVPLFSDDSVGCFSYRAWGDLMAAIATEIDGQDHGYMDFYMECLIGD